jgi:SAM-dependent methyltransferase
VDKLGALPPDAASSLLGPIANLKTLAGLANFGFAVLLYPLCCTVLRLICRRLPNPAVCLCDLSLSNSLHIRDAVVTEHNLLNDPTDVKGGSPDRFGYSWENFNDLTPDQEEQFRRWTAPLDLEKDWHGKRFLDVGCGMGRNSYWPMMHGAAAGVAIDVDERSLAAARRNLARFPTVEVLHRSAYDLEERNVFDIAFSIGVIHHLEDPGRAVQRMRQAVKPGGAVLIWVYGYENMEHYVWLLNPLRNHVFSRIPVSLVRYLAYVPAALLWMFLRLGLSRLEYFRLLRRFTFRHLHHIVFDQMIPRIANYWRKDEVELLMQQACLNDIRLVWVNEMSWAAVGYKAAETILDNTATSQTHSIDAP